MAASAPRSNFELLRVLAVGIVVYGNGLVLTSAPPSALWGAPLPRIGLDLLFSIAGFLATQSWNRRRQIAPYAARRLLRVFPALIVCVLVTVFVIGPLATRLSLRAYFLDGMTRRYLGNMLLMPQLWLPRVFEGQQWVGTVDPMLWTLTPGLLCCMLVPLFGRLPRPTAVAGACAALCAALCLLWPVLLPDLPHALARPVIADSLTEVPFFFVAAAFGFAEPRWGARLWRADLAMLCFAANWLVATWLDQWTIVLAWLSLPYMAIAFGRLSLPVLGRFGALGNPSYGMYLYAFPLQQLVVERLPHAPAPILACFALSMTAGYLSWHLIERPALYWGPALWESAILLRPRALQ